MINVHTCIGYAKYPRTMADAAIQANEASNAWLDRFISIDIEDVVTTCTSYRDHTGDYEVQAYEFAITIVYRKESDPSNDDAEEAAIPF